jgi:hypothetical protein
MIAKDKTGLPVYRAIWPPAHVGARARGEVLKVVEVWVEKNSDSASPAMKHTSILARPPPATRANRRWEAPH